MTEATVDLKWIDGLMVELARQCPPIFHSEADFQHKLAWLLQEERKLDVHLEYPYPPKLFQVQNPYSSRLNISQIRNKRGYLDIWLPDKGIAIELKCATKRLHQKLNGELFKLSDQRAQNQRRYDFFKDVERLQRFRDQSDKDEYRAGFAVFLTNDPLYWKFDWDHCEKRHSGNKDRDFHLCNGRKIKSRTLKWRPNSKGKKPSKKSIRGREERICLSDSYYLQWKCYSDLKISNDNGKFHYLALRVPPLE